MPIQTYAKRMRIWPPENFTEPTRDELLAILKNRTRFHFRKIDTDTLIRWVQVIMWFGRDPATRSVEIYDFHHEINRELQKRGSFARSLGILRCEVCSHGTERLWETSTETHSIEKYGEPVSAFVCSRCWSSTYTNEEG